MNPLRLKQIFWSLSFSLPLSLSFPFLKIVFKGDLFLVDTDV